MTQVVISPIVERRLRALESALRSARLPLVGAPGFSVDGLGRPLLPPGSVVPGGGLVPPGSPPPPPTGLMLTAGAGGGDVWVDMDWTPAPSGLAGPVVAWFVEILADGDTLPRVEHPLASVAPPFKVSGLLADTLYHFTVRAVTQLGASSIGLTGDRLTGHDTGPPPALTGLAGAAYYTGAVISWTHIGSIQVPFQGHYDAQLATNAGFTAGVQTKPTGLGTVASFAGLTTGQQVWLRVRAVSTAGVNGPWSAAITLTPGKVGPGDLGAGTIATGVLYAGDIYGDQIVGGTIDAAIANIINLNATNISAGSMSVGRLGAGTIGAYLIQLANGGIIRSANYNPGVAGWQIDGAGNSELNNVIVRGVLAAVRLAANDLTIYDSGGQPAIRLLTEMVTGTPRSWLQLGSGQYVGAGLNWFADQYWFALAEPGAGRPGLTISGADVEYEKLIRAHGSIAVGGNPYEGGVYPAAVGGPSDTNWGFELDSDVGAGTYLVYTKGWLDGTGDRRVGWYNSFTNGWLAYANTNGDLNSRTSWFVFSERNLKKAVKPLGPMTERLKQLKPVSYLLRSGDDHRTLPRLGLIAEDVEPVFPELISKAAGTPMGLDYVGLIPALVAGFAEMDARIAALEPKVKIK